MDVDYHEWGGEDGFRGGQCRGVAVESGGMRIDAPAGVQDGGEYGWWTSPVRAHGFDATELVASWNADTPPGTWLTVEIQAHTGSGQDTAWYVLARWAYHDTDIRRTSVAGQGDEHARVDVDRLVAAPGESFRAHRLRVTLHRAAGTGASPVLSAVGAVASRTADRVEVPVSAPGPARGIELPVPRYSQTVHRGGFAEYGGGGESWCSPACTEMVLEYWGVGPSQEELSWVPREHPDRSVVHAARHTYDHGYDGTGNWSFNTAYAAHHGLAAHVTRLRDLTELEHHLAEGVPVITSQSFSADELDGAGYDTEGHLMVVVGVTEAGDVVVNDPAADTAEAVRRTYPRAQFETVWQRTRRHTAQDTAADRPAGVAYLVTPARHR